MREKGFDMHRNGQAFAQSQLLTADRGGGQIPTHEQVRRGLSERGCEATKSEVRRGLDCSGCGEFGFY